MTSLFQRLLIAALFVSMLIPAAGLTATDGGGGPGVKVEAPVDQEVPVDGEVPAGEVIPAGKPAPSGEGAVAPFADPLTASSPFSSSPSASSPSSPSLSTRGTRTADIVWNVTGDEVKTGGTDVITGSVIINDGESLTLTDHTLIFDPGGNDNCHIIVQPGGALIIDGSTLTTPSLEKGIVIKVHGSIDARDSAFSHLGGEYVDSYLLGGLWLFTDDSTINGCTFNESIYGITAQSCEPVVRNCTFTGNYMGMLASNCSVSGVRGNIFSENDYGLYVQDGEIDLGYNAYGGNTGGLFLKRVSGRVTYETITGNYQGLSMDKARDLTVDNTTLENNTIVGAPVHDSNVTFTDCAFDLNQDGLSVSSSWVEVVRCTFTRNQYKDDTVTASLRALMEGGEGGARCNDPECDDPNCTGADCDGENCSGENCDGSTTTTCGSVSQASCADPNIHGAGIYASLSDITVKDSAFTDNGAGLMGLLSTVTVLDSDLSDGSREAFIVLNQTAGFNPDELTPCTEGGTGGYIDPPGSRGGTDGVGSGDAGGADDDAVRGSDEGMDKGAGGEEAGTRGGNGTLNLVALGSMNGWGFGLALDRCTASVTGATLDDNPYGGVFMESSDVTFSGSSAAGGGLLGLLSVGRQPQSMTDSSFCGEEFDTVHMNRVGINVIDSYGDRVSHATVLLTAIGDFFQTIQTLAILTTERGTSEVPVVSAVGDCTGVMATVEYTTHTSRDNLSATYGFTADFGDDETPTLELILDIPKPDLVITGIDTSGHPREGEPMTITVEVRNDGDAESGKATVQVVWSRDDRSRVIDTRDIPPLAPGAASEVSVEFEPESTGDYDITARVDHQGLVDESDEFNNDLAVSVEVIEKGEPIPLYYFVLAVAAVAVIAGLLLWMRRKEPRDE